MVQSEGKGEVETLILEGGETMRLLMPGVMGFHLEGSTQNHELELFSPKRRIEAKPTSLPPPLTPKCSEQSPNILSKGNPLLGHPRRAQLKKP